MTCELVASFPQQKQQPLSHCKNKLQSSNFSRKIESFKYRSIGKKDKRVVYFRAAKKRLGLYFWQLGQVQCGHKSCVVCAVAQQENRKNRWGLKCSNSCLAQPSSTAVRVLKGFFGQAVTAACILYKRRTKRARKQGHKKAILPKSPILACQASNRHLANRSLSRPQLSWTSYRSLLQLSIILLEKMLLIWKA